MLYCLRWGDQPSRERRTCDAVAGVQVYGLSLEANHTHLVVDLSNNLPPRDAKKGAKLYDVATPLLHAEVCATATNSGVAILRAAFKPTLALCGLPRLAVFEDAAAGRSGDLLALGAAADDDEEAAAAGSRPECAASVVMVVGGKLIGATFTTPDPQLMDGEGSDGERAALGRSIPAKLQAPGHAPPLEVAVSHRCRFGWPRMHGSLAPVCLTCVCVLSARCTTEQNTHACV